VEESLVPTGNPPRPRSLLYLLLGVAALSLLFASDAHFALSVPLGLAAALLSAFGVLDFVGSFDDAQPASLRPISLSRLKPRLLELAVVSLLWLLSLRLAVAGVPARLPWLRPALVTLGASAWVISCARSIALLSAPGPRLRDQPGLWLMLLGVVLYLPALGAYSLLDPWETHYAEVTREMLARDDWISLWWAHEGWFWSKPVLDFWLQGLCFSLLGVKFEPDGVLGAAAQGALPAPEWAARLPVVLLTLLAVLALYGFVAKAAGKRAGFLAGLVLLCAPYWSLLAHQSMTDMPYVAPLTIAVSLFGLGLLADPQELAPSVQVVLFGRRLLLSAFHLLFCIVLLSSLPQLCYLLSRNLSLQLVAPPYGFRFHFDEFFAGSGLGNCGLPGNEACRRGVSSNPFFQPALGAALFGAALGYLVYVNRGERRKKRLFYVAAWYFTALSALAKGAPGLVLPLVIAAAVLLSRRNLSELLHVELASFCLVFAAVCLPWYVQAYMRHGDGFTDRLLFHDMYKRAFVHVHDTNAGTDVSLRYYVWQLGYGLFPWTGLLLPGLGLVLSQSSSRVPRLRELSAVTGLWLCLAFALFTLSLTKFHHYALPCAPPLAVAAALLLDRALAEHRLPSGYRAAAYLAALGSASLLAVMGGLRLQAGSLFGDVPLADAAPLWGAALLVLALLLTWLAARVLAPESPRGYRDPTLAALAVLIALGSLLVARDLSTSIDGDVPGSARLLHLVTYNYKRSWPETLDFEAAAWGFGVAMALSVGLLALPRARPHAALLTCTVGVWFCAYTLWIYLPALAPHFGQRELFLEYYRTRSGPEQPIVAYQMNWKGENFYSGNRLPAFVTTGAKFSKWLKRQRKAGVKTLFFVTEHGRYSTLKSELGSGFMLQRLTDKRLNDKFELVRAELLPETPASSD
jgi:4-amino-4-deoxy-L-arabinose transferase-like glycosyltransferase